MVGLALVATIAVFGASLSKSATNSVDEAVSADYIITPSSNGSAGFSNSVGPAAARIPGVTAVSTVYNGSFETGGSVDTLTGISAQRLSDTILLRLQSGSGAPALNAGEILIDSTTATNRHLAVGSRVQATFARTGTSTLRVGGVFASNPLLGSYVASDTFFAAHYRSPLPVAVLVSTDGSQKTGAALTASIASTYPNLQVQTRAAFEASERKQVNQLLGLVYALLALAVLIALIGIVNTLMLSVFERTHEIGLLRAVGMRRRQIRAMIRSESVILSVFGAIIGVMVGTALGVVFAASLKAQGITDIVVPVGSLVLFLVLSAVLGLGAATWPARRAAKLDVLAAIASE
jgi:putative ABC transport system permease protein